VLLAEEDLNELRDLAAKADRHWAMLNHNHGLVATVKSVEEDGKVVAVNHYHNSGSSGHGGRNKRRRGRGGGQPNNSSSNNQATDG
jgi:hypothetical protein